MTGVIKKFFIASMFMWIAPIAILFGFSNNWLPGTIVELNVLFDGFAIDHISEDEISDD